MIRQNRRVAAPEFASYEEAWAFAGPKVKQIADDIALLLKSVASALAADGFVAVAEQPFETHDDDYGYMLGISVTDPNTDEQYDDWTVDVQVELLDSVDASEPTDPDWGVNIAVHVSTAEGRGLGSYVPYNYSANVWTKSPDELTRRMDQFDALDVAEAISKFYDEHE